MDELRHPDFPVFWVVVAIAAAFGILIAAVAAIYLGYSGARAPAPPAPADFGAPRLETAPVARHEAWAARQRALLDGAEGRLPIAEAMRHVRERADPYAPLPLPDDGGTR